MRKFLVAAFCAALLTGGVAAGTSVASATTATPSPTVTVTPSHTPSYKPKPKKHFNPCPSTVASDYLAKTDNGHGTPSEWANLKFKRTVLVTKGHFNFKTRDCTYTVFLADKGSLKTIQGAGSPSGAAVQIANSVPGSFAGVYRLTITGHLKHHVHHGDVSAAGSTAYVLSLFYPGATQGPKSWYAWKYRTVCGERWTDASFNNDGQALSAGNITGKTCRACHPKPTPTPTVPPVVTQPVPGEAVPATPIKTQPNFTG